MAKQTNVGLLIQKLRLGKRQRALVAADRLRQLLVHVYGRGYAPRSDSSRDAVIERRLDGPGAFVEG